jgi:hypothetical protein
MWVHALGQRKKHVSQAVKKAVDRPTIPGTYVKASDPQTAALKFIHSVFQKIWSRKAHIGIEEKEQFSLCHLGAAVPPEPRPELWPCHQNRSKLSGDPLGGIRRTGIGYDNLVIPPILRGNAF